MKKLLTIVLFLMFMIPGKGEPASFWSGEVSFPVTVTYLDIDSQFNAYLTKEKTTLRGKFYLDPLQQLLPSQLGSTFNSPSFCLAGFISNDGANEIWIYNGALLESSDSRKKNQKSAIVGTGTFFDYDAGVSAAAYIDASGTIKVDNNYYITAVNINGRIGAGMEPHETWLQFFVLTGQFSGTLK